MVKKIGKYELGKTLGKGTFSKVKYGLNTENNQAFAIKIIDKSQLAKEHMEEQLKREIAIMKHLKHDHIVQMKEVLQTAKHIYIVLDLITGGELFDRIVAAKRFDENTGRKYFQQLINAIYYCHQQGIAHRDLKPENLLLDGQDRLKVSDFGLSNLQQRGNDSAMLQTVCGTPNYVAPEVLKEKGYNGFNADVWSCGVILFVMLAGYLPFDDPNMNALFNKIERGEFRMAKYFSNDVKDLITKMLVVDPAKRMSLDEVIATPWFRVGWDDAKFQEMKTNVSKIMPSAAQCNEAIVDASMSEGPSSSATSPSEETAEKQPTVTAGLDAFDIVSRLTSGSLNPLMSGSLNVIRRATRFIAVGATDTVQAKVMEALEKAKSNPKAKDGSLEIKGFINSAKGLLTYHLEILPLVAQGLVLVEIRRTRGDTLDFHEFFRYLIETLGPLTLSYGKIKKDG
jgi:serine/threonine protein kinase